MTNVLLLLLLSSTVIGESSADEPPLKVHAFAGLDATLPCLQPLPADTEVPTIEWSKPGIEPAFVYVHRQGFEVYEDKHPDYEFRTHLFMTQLQHGNFSMHLSDVRLADAGTYRCKTLWSPQQQETRTVELLVEELPEPQLSTQWADGGAVNVTCEVRSCSPVVPRLTIHDDRGQVLEAEKTEPSPEEATNCYTVVQKTQAPPGVKSVVCHAEFKEVGQSRKTRFLIPELTKENCTLPVFIAIIVTGLGVLLLAGCIFLTYKISRLSKKGRLSRQSTDDTTPSENQDLLGSPGPSAFVEMVQEETRSNLALSSAAATAPRSNSMGSTALGSNSMGSTALGSNSMGSTALGSNSIGSTALGSNSIGSTAAGSNSIGSTALGSNSMGSTALGSNSIGSTALGSNSIGSTALGSNSIGSTALGSNSIGSMALGSNSIGSTAPGSNSIGSRAIGENGSVLVHIPEATGLCDEAVVKPATCEIDGEEMVTFKNTKSMKKLIRQNASKNPLPNVTPNHGVNKLLPPRKFPLKRSLSASEASIMSSLFDVKNRRRYSLSSGFEQLKEEPEPDVFNSV